MLIPTCFLTCSIVSPHPPRICLFRKNWPNLIHRFFLQISDKTASEVAGADRTLLCDMFLERYADENVYAQYGDIMQGQLRGMGSRASTVDLAEYLKLLEDKGLMPSVISKTEATRVFRCTPQTDISPFSIISLHLISHVLVDSCACFCDFVASQDRQQRTGVG